MSREIASDWVWCEHCQKRRYRTRRAARRAAKNLPGHRAGTYGCEVFADGWHVGRLPTRVRLGEVTRAEHFATKRVTGLRFVDVA